LYIKIYNEDGESLLNRIKSIVTIGIIAAHILFFAVIARYFSIFEHHPEDANHAIANGFHRKREQVVPERI